MKGGKTPDKFAKDYMKVRLSSQWTGTMMKILDITSDIDWILHRNSAFPNSQRLLNAHEQERNQILK